MNPNVPIAAITASGSIIVVISALVLNSRGFTMIDSRINDLLRSIDVRFGGVERRLDVIEADLKRFFEVQALHDADIARIKDKTGLH